MSQKKTLGEFIIENQQQFKYSSGELSRLLNSIRLACKIVNHEVNKAALVDILGVNGQKNIQGEEQQKLDVYANEVFKKALINRDIICGIASEEDEDYIKVPSNNNKYVVLIDPLDGSSNIDVNASVGTIFSIYRRLSPVGSEVTKKDFLQKGNKQVAAGYIAYGTSTILVYTTGAGVNGFTLNPTLGTFYLSHPNIKFPVSGNILSLNICNYPRFDNKIKKYITFLNDKTNVLKTFRYIGSFVSDFHRNMIKGGLYIYPKDTKNPNGKLRLMYECNPIAFIAEQAGGKASNGSVRILDIQPNSIHQRSPMFCGNSDLVIEVEKFLL